MKEITFAHKYIKGKIDLQSSLSVGIYSTLNISKYFNFGLNKSSMIIISDNLNIAFLPLS